MVARPGRSTGRNAGGRAEHAPTRERRALVGASCARPPGPLTGTERPRACRACPCRGVAGEHSSPLQGNDPRAELPLRENYFVGVGATCGRPPGPLNGTERLRACGAHPCRGVVGPVGASCARPSAGKARSYRGTVHVLSSPLRENYFVSVGATCGRPPGPLNGTERRRACRARPYAGAAGEQSSPLRGTILVGVGASCARPPGPAQRDGTPAGVQSTPLQGHPVSGLKMRFSPGDTSPGLRWESEPAPWCPGPGP